MIKAVIFDMDGVLIDSQPIHYEADRLTLSKLGVTVAHKDLEKYTGTSNPNRFAKFKEDFKIIQSISDITKIQEDIIFELISKQELTAISGIIELLEDLKINNIKMAVASSSSYRFINTILDKLDITKYFTEIVSGEDMKNSKPSPDIFLKTAEKLNVANEECVVIEDSENGVLAAISAGMKCIGYINITSGNQNLSKATVIIDDFKKITTDFVVN